MKDTQAHQAQEDGLISDLEPFSQIPDALTNDTSLSVYARMVYVKIATYTHKGQMQAWPSTSTIATTLNIHRNTVTKALKELEGTWLTISKVKRATGMGNLYTIHGKKQVAHDTSGYTPVGVAHEECKGMHTTSAEVCTPDVQEQYQGNHNNLTTTTKQAEPEKTAVAEPDTKHVVAAVLDCLEPYGIESNTKTRELVEQAVSNGVTPDNAADLFTACLESIKDKSGIANRSFYTLKLFSAPEAMKRLEKVESEAARAARDDTERALKQKDEMEAEYLKSYQEFEEKGVNPFAEVKAALKLARG